MQQAPPYPLLSRDVPELDLCWLRQMRWLVCQQAPPTNCTSYRTALTTGEFLVITTQKHGIWKLRQSCPVSRPICCSMGRTIQRIIGILAVMLLLPVAISRFVDKGNPSAARACTVRMNLCNLHFSFSLSQPLSFVYMQFISAANLVR